VLGWNYTANGVVSGDTLEVKVYGIEMAQWASFFNTLDNTQKTTRDITSNANGGKNTDGLSLRNNVSWTSGDATLPGGEINYSAVAANYISWGDFIAYLD